MLHDVTIGGRGVNAGTYVGLARGYTALGDTRNAIANWEIAIENIPDNQKVNLPVYEQALKTLKERSQHEYAFP